MPMHAATRDRLLEVTSQIGDVCFGKGLLEKKRDALIRSMEGERRVFKDLQSLFRQLCHQISTIYGLVRAYEGAATIELLRLQRSPVFLLTRKESVLGCGYLSFTPDCQEEYQKRPLTMDPALSSFYLEDLLDLISKAENILWRYVSLRSKIQAFERELKKTNLKINTLEHTLLPSLSEERKRILETLSERERQERFAIKKLTKKKREQ